MLPEAAPRQETSTCGLSYINCEYFPMTPFPPNTGNPTDVRFALGNPLPYLIVATVSNAAKL